MNKAYNEPEFKVVISSAQDVLTTSVAEPEYNKGQFETNPQPFIVV